uniref:Stress response protein nst1 n=1 Tax=Anthurium amnicola TaxID=1678845 RepID=A0A1D1YM07_9ARAE
MPGLVQRSVQLGNAAAPLCSSSVTAVGSTAANGIWSKHRDAITFDRLQKFWSDLPPHARCELLRIDKQTLFEQARKNLYCSRCNGLLLEGFSQIVLYGKSLQQGDGVRPPSKLGAVKNEIDKEFDDMQDPSVHPWGGLVGARDGMLTLLDCFIYGRSLRPLQTVFDGARARERERELLYPDACGGGGRGWIGHGMSSYGRGLGARETCALHTARLSCDTLVDFWSALSDETRLSLLRMKEEDFIERLMYRDCRRNVIREFKELKELKRMRREPCCTSWFCVADTSFQYEVSDDTVQADWHQSFKETVGSYHRFEWAIGTGEGKFDILEFEDVGMNGKVHVNGLDLGGLSACFITLRAWRLDGRCTELTVKAHGLKGQPCVHRRLVVGDGYVTITKGENIRRFFEHSEEVEEEEDDDAIDKDGNELDGDGSRPQKHAKSPELAREFLLDAATVIFKEQVEKAFREGTARQNAHSTFVCLALKLLEERVHVACKEIVTLEKQFKLLEEEEKERREEEERKERKRAKEKEKKLRRKERLKVKEKERERKNTEFKLLPTVLPSMSPNESSTSTVDEPLTAVDSEDSFGDTGDVIFSMLCSVETVDESSTAYANSEVNVRDDHDSFVPEQSKSSRRKLRSKKAEVASKWCDKRQYASGNGCLHEDSAKLLNGYKMGSSRFSNGEHRQFTANALKATTRECGSKYSEKFHCSNSRVRDKYDFHSCGCNHHGDYNTKEGHVSTIRSGRENKTGNGTFDTVVPLHRSGKYGPSCFMLDNFVMSKGNLGISVHSRRGKLHQIKQVWEPTDPRKKCSRSNPDPHGTSGPLARPELSEEAGCNVVETRCEEAPTSSILQELDRCSFEASINSAKTEAIDAYECQKGNESRDGGYSALGLETKSHCYPKDGADEDDLGPIASAYSMNDARDPLMSSSSSDNCSSCLSEGDSSTSSSSTHNAESSSISDSEDAMVQLEGREILACVEDASKGCHEDGKPEANGVYSSPTVHADGHTAANFPRDKPLEAVFPLGNELHGFNMAPQQRPMLPIHNKHLHVPMFPLTPMGYHNQSPVPWTSVPGNQMVSFPQAHHLMISRPLGYGLPTNPSSDFCMEYNALQPLPTPLNLGHFPPYKISNEANVIHPNQLNEDHKSSKIGGAQGTYIPKTIGYRRPLERPVLNRDVPPKLQSAGGNDSFGSTAKSRDDTPSFSLFHFGGPMAMASGHDLNPAFLEEESSGSVPLNLLEKQTDLNCNIKETEVEEYSLFSSSNGVRFAFLG